MTNSALGSPWPFLIDDDDDGGGGGGDDDDDGGGGGGGGDDDDDGGGGGGGDDDDDGGCGSGGDDDDDGGNCDEDPSDPYCEAGAGDCPCGNDSPGGVGGCTNSVGGNSSISGSGSASVAADDLVLTASELPPGNVGLFLMALGTTRSPLGNGLLCVAPPPGEKIFRFPATAIGADGTLSIGPGIVAFADTNFEVPIGQIDPGETWYFQVWYRDIGGPCGATSNLSSGSSVTFTP